MNSNDLVDHHEVAINSLEFERQVRELRRVTALGWLAVFLLAAILFVVAANWIRASELFTMAACTFMSGAPAKHPPH